MLKKGFGALIRMLRGLLSGPSQTYDPEAPFGDVTVPLIRQTDPSLGLVAVALNDRSWCVTKSILATF